MEHVYTDQLIPACPRYIQNLRHLLFIITEGTFLQTGVPGQTAEQKDRRAVSAEQWWCKLACLLSMHMFARNIQNGNPARMEEMPWHFPHPSQSRWHLPHSAAISKPHTAVKWHEKQERECIKTVLSHNCFWMIWLATTQAKKIIEFNLQHYTNYYKQAVGHIFLFSSPYLKCFLSACAGVTIPCARRQACCIWLHCFISTRALGAIPTLIMLIW